MTTITLSIEDRLLDEVREIAARQQTSVEDLVRTSLTRIAEEGRLAEARKSLRELMDNSTARLGPNYKWNREEIYADRLFPRHERPALRGDGDTG